MLIRGILEITIGIEALSKLGLSVTYKAIIASCFLAFGGLSVHMQVMSQIVDTDIKYKYTNIYFTNFVKKPEITKENNIIL